MELLLLLLIAAASIVSAGFLALHLLCAAQIVTKKIISFKKAFKISPAVYLTSFATYLTLLLSGFSFKSSVSVLDQSTGSPFLMVFLATFAVSWYLNSTYITADESGRRYFLKGLAVTSVF